MNNLKKVLTTVAISLIVILIHVGLLNKIQKNLNAIEYDFKSIF